MKKTFFASVLVLMFMALFVIVSKTQAAIPFNTLGGWAWSDTIGWISLDSKNCDTNGDGSLTAAESAAHPGCPTVSGGSIAAPKYGVSVDTGTGYLTGWAWSDNIGWVKFGGWQGGFPAGGVGTDAQILQDYTLSGWIRACAGLNSPDTLNNQTVPNDTCTGSSRTDGWDGWISLSGKGKNPAWGLTYNDSTKKFTGYAWGSDVVGWVSFENVTVSGGDCNPAVESCPGSTPMCTGNIPSNGTRCYSTTLFSGQHTYLSSNTCPSPLPTQTLQNSCTFICPLNQTYDSVTNTCSGGGGGGGNNQCTGTYPEGAMKCDASVGGAYNAVASCSGSVPTCAYQCPSDKPYNSITKQCGGTVSTSCELRINGQLVSDTNTNPRARVGDLITWSIGSIVKWSGPEVPITAPSSESYSLRYHTIGRKIMQYQLGAAAPTSCLPGGILIVSSDANIEEN